MLVHLELAGEQLTAQGFERLDVVVDLQLVRLTGCKTTLWVQCSGEVGQVPSQQLFRPRQTEAFSRIVLLYDNGVEVVGIIANTIQMSAQLKTNPDNDSDNFIVEGAELVSARHGVQ